jgi:hypothetical protein
MGGNAALPYLFHSLLGMAKLQVASTEADEAMTNNIREAKKALRNYRRESTIPKTSPVDRGLETSREICE